jgi:hypothetical protein
MGTLRASLLLLAALLFGFQPGAALDFAMAAPGGQTLVICSDLGATTITLDADGNPVETADHRCHDCCLVSAHLPGVADLTSPARTLEPAASRPAPVTTFAGPALPIRLGRGPPAWI